MRRYLEQVFNDAGYAATTAAGGEQALAAAARRQPDCITMDLRMPGMDGKECIRRLRAQPATRHIPVVAVSAASGHRPQESGADAAVLKPVDQEALLDTVRGLLQGPDRRPSRPCLIYTRNGSHEVSRRLFMCPGDATTLNDETALWLAAKDGFQGSVFIPASLGHAMDLERLAAFPGLHIVIFPD